VNARKSIIGLFFITVIVSDIISTSIASERVHLENNQLLVDGKPFFFFGIDGVPDSFESVRAHHFNTIFFWQFPGDKLKTLVQKASGAGLMVIPYLSALRWDLQYERFVKEVEPKSAILAWNIGNDLRDEHVEKIQTVYEKIHQIDPNRLMMLDGTPKAYRWFDELYGFYAYRLLGHRTLLDYQKYLVISRKKVSLDRFFWTWVQSHVQIWYIKKYLNPTGKWTPSRYPDAEHIRLLTYCALAAGSKGIIYFHRRYFSDRFFGSDRYSEAGIIGCELEVLGPWLAQGQKVKDLKSPVPNVDIKAIDFPSGKLLFMIRLNDDYQYHVDTGSVEAFELRFPQKLSEEETIYQIGFPNGVQKCHVEKNVIQVPGFELTQVFLITAEAELVQKTQEQFAKLLPEVATFAVMLSKAKLKKTIEVRNQLKDLKVPEKLLPSIDKLMKAQKLLNKAEKELQDKSHASAYSNSREAQRIIRASVYTSWRSMKKDKTLRGESLQDYYLMPFFYEKALAKN
jgi:hypothetical protein